jgi:O-antigen ligase
LTKTLYDTKDDINLLIDKNYTSSIGLRSLWAINGMNNIYEKPLFGIGVGGYEDSIRNFISKNNINVQENLAVSNNPHNEFVSISTQLGLFGLMLYTLFLYSLFKEARNNFLRSGVFVLVFVSSFFNSTFYDNVFGLFIVMIISLVYQKHFNE